MTATIMSSKTTAILWADVIEYPDGVKSKILLCLNRLVHFSRFTLNQNKDDAAKNLNRNW